MNRKPRILLVDDDTSLLDALRRLLVLEGYDVTTADGGKKALAILEDITPDVIILDIKMPGMSGLGFLREISLPDDKPKYPVIILTARANMGDFFDGVDVDAFMEKPCSPNKLIAEIERVLQSRGVDIVAPAAEAEELTPSAGQSGSKVLVADDDPVANKSIQRRLRDAGFDVEGVVGSDDVIERVMFTRPHVLVVKRVMAGMNGDRIAALLSEIPKTAEIPIVMYEPGADTGSASRLIKRYTNVKQFVCDSDTTRLLIAVRSALRAVARP